MRVASDIGGTFTDLVYHDERSGETSFAKTSTTPDDFARGVLDAIRKAQFDTVPASFFVHGSTVVINALTERKGARTGLITTRGFRDVLEIGRANRPDIYNFSYQKPRPFVPRHLRMEVGERVNYKGQVLEPLDEADVRAAVAFLLEEGVEAIAVCFMHSYANPSHERRAVGIIREEAPEVAVTASHEVTRQWREYERTSTAVLNAYVQPVTSRYPGNLEQELQKQGTPRDVLHVMQSNGGIATFDQGRTTPIRLVESGPVAGVVGAIAIGRMVGEPNIISLDIGGTTAKSSLVQQGELSTTTEYKIEQTTASAGYPIMASVVDIVEIGAGGGSIAWIDRAGALKVGPRSAGAVPGPACHGAGGTEPTVTDANLLTGRINPEYFLGGEITVDVEAARQAMRKIAEPFGLTEAEAALGVIRLANSNMDNLLRVVSVRRGFDPREYALVASGGGGSMHATALARRLHIEKVVVPVATAVFSALGMLMTDLRVDVIQTAINRADHVGSPDVMETLAKLETEGFEALQGERIERDRIVIQRSADMRYLGQEHTVRVPLPSGIIDQAALRGIERCFHDLHERQYTFRLDSPAEFVNFHVTALGLVEKPNLRVLEPNRYGVQWALKGYRDVHFDESGWQRSAIYERERLGAGDEVDGPAVVEEPAASTVLFPGDHLTVDRFGNLIIKVDM